MIALGAVAALAVTSFAGLGGRERKVLATAGSFSAISTLFGGPIVAGVLMLEGGLGLGAALIPALLPGFVAAAVGYLVFDGFGDWGGLDAPGLVVPNLELYDGVHLLDLVVAVAVGVVTALALAGVVAHSPRPSAARRAAQARHGRAAAGRRPARSGCVAQLADVLGADSQDVLFSGQASIPALVSESSTGDRLLVLVAKALAYAISLACGFRGGPIFPAMFLASAWRRSRSSGSTSRRPSRWRWAQPRAWRRRRG